MFTGKSYKFCCSFYHLATVACIVVTLLLLFLAILYMPIRQLLMFIPDDAAYYFKIALNRADGHGFSFDTFEDTNGFHPLWQFMLSVLAYTSHYTPAFFFRMVLLFQLILISGSSILLYAVYKKYFTPAGSFLGLLFYVVFAILHSINGMESSLMIFILSLLLYFHSMWVSFSEARPIIQFFYGLLVGLLILSRLDTIFFLPPIAICFLYARKDSLYSYIYSILPLGVGIALLLVPYLLYNVLYFGYAMPISGVLKSGFMQFSFFSKVDQMLYYRESYFILFPVLFLLWYFFQRKSLVLGALLSFMMVLAWGLLIQYVYYTICIQFPLFAWYFVTYAFFGSLFIGYAISLVGRIFSSSLYILTLIIASSFVGYRIKNIKDCFQSSNWSQQSYDAALWVRDHTSPEAVFAMSDAGHFSFFSERRVINLDGLVNSFDYQKIICKKQTEVYLQEHKVRYVVLHSTGPYSQLTDDRYELFPYLCYSWQYNCVSDTIWLKRSDEIYRSSLYEDMNTPAHLLIWERY